MKGREREGKGKGREGLNVVHCGYATRFTSAEVDDA